ncbi:MAG: hypothetical protein A3F67_05140 [Verrucomicrobia bacterium RIFCSPHIGHO2_12_FULL_41_10]|nr:MAG: hypothetical protein A3F67_05140 [Verrucomicrobia bacterium RIFCSPHIGHO2_12_FULL_41_10]
MAEEYEKIPLWFRLWLNKKSTDKSTGRGWLASDIPKVEKELGDVQSAMKKASRPEKEAVQSTMARIREYLRFREPEFGRVSGVSEASKEASSRALPFLTEPQLGRVTQIPGSAPIPMPGTVEQYGALVPREGGALARITPGLRRAGVLAKGAGILGKAIPIAGYGLAAKDVMNIGFPIAAAALREAPGERLVGGMTEAGRQYTRALKEYAPSVLGGAAKLAGLGIGPIPEKIGKPPLGFISPVEAQSMAREQLAKRNLPVPQPEGEPPLPQPDGAKIPIKTEKPVNMNKMPEVKKIVDNAVSTVKEDFSKRMSETKIPGLFLRVLANLNFQYSPQTGLMVSRNPNDFYTSLIMAKRAMHLDDLDRKRKEAKTIEDRRMQDKLYDLKKKELDKDIALLEIKRAQQKAEGEKSILPKTVKQTKFPPKTSGWGWWKEEIEPGYTKTEITPGVSGDASVEDVNDLKKYSQ